MELTSTSFADGGRIPGEHAFCIEDAHTHVCLGGNRNPQLAWSGLPAGTRSLVLICHDRDVPSSPDDVNREGRTIPASLARVDFFHWVLADLPPQPASIAAGEFCDGVTAHGKSGPAAARGTRQGLNDYTGWFATDADMAGNYFGYDGPCPPWNDAIVHHYVFTLIALDIDRLPLEGAFTGAQAREAIRGHVLAQASLTGIYSLNPALRG